MCQRLNTPFPYSDGHARPRRPLRSSVRFSFGATTTEAEIDEAIRRITQVIGRIDIEVSTNHRFLSHTALCALTILP